MRFSNEQTLQRTREFWNASPCGAQISFEQRVRHRYGLEPWVQDVLGTIAARHKDVLEIGCGQGTDGIMLCSQLPPAGSYVGVDYSDDSIGAAKRARAEAADLLVLNVEPVFRRANAESLDVPDSSVMCVYSNGVLHHTASPERAYAEIWRVLAPGGEAFIMLYRKPSLKVGGAKTVRALQAFLDAVLRQDRCLYRVIQRHFASKRLGTMLLEGVGVPVMEWYSRADIAKLFGRFDILAATPVGQNIPRFGSASRGWTRWGYMWFLHLRKPVASPGTQGLTK